VRRDRTHSPVVAWYVDDLNTDAHSPKPNILLDPDILIEARELYIKLFVLLRRYLLHWVEKALLSAAACKSAGVKVIAIPTSFLLSILSTLRESMVSLQLRYMSIII